MLVLLSASQIWLAVLNWEECLRSLEPQRGITMTITVDVIVLGTGVAAQRLPMLTIRLAQQMERPQLPPTHARWLSARLSSPLPH
jgi:hypothetical protein